MKFAISYNIDLRGTALVVFADVPYSDAPTPRDAERSWRVPGDALVAGVFPAPPQAHDGSLVPLSVVEVAVARAREDRANAVRHPARRLERCVQFMGSSMRVACDGLCSKAWGVEERPSIQLTDGVAWLSDAELGEAPIDPGTRENDQGKPTSVHGPGDLNRWCVRQCERCVSTPRGAPNAPIVLHDFAHRVYTQRWTTRDEGGSDDGDEGSDDGFLDLLRDEVRDVLGELAKVARALSSAPDDTEARARVCPRSADRHPWQIGTLEQICRNQAAEVRVLARRLQRAMGAPASEVDSADPTATATPAAPYAHDDRD